MTHIEDSELGELPRHRWLRVFRGVSVPLFALMTCYSLFQFVRGQPDIYPNEREIVVINDKLEVQRWKQ